MIILNKNLPVIVKQKVDDGFIRIKKFIQQIWLKVAFVLLLILIVTQKEFSFQFTIGSAANAQQSSAAIWDSPTLHSDKKEPAPKKKNNTNTAPASATEKKWWESIKEESKDIRSNMNLANEATAVSAALTPAQQKEAAKFSNLGFVLSPNFAKEHGISDKIVQAKKKICLDYIAQYSKTAQDEATKFNIPASITLAQGLLESNAGKSGLAAKENNHFGIKCRAKCIGCRCANYTDDSKFDMFRIFDSAWESFREHSNLLSNTRYKHLCNMKRTDYKNWANGLQAAGYATDKKYAYKLIRIIEAFDLSKFDR